MSKKSLRKSIKKHVGVFFTKLIDGAIYGTGFVLFYAFIGAVAVVLFTEVDVSHAVQKVFISAGVIEKPVQEPDEVKTTVRRVFSTHKDNSTVSYKPVYVSNTAEFLSAVSEANKVGNYEIILAEGEYSIQNVVNITAEHVYIRSELNDPYSVVLRGKGMFKTGVAENLIRVSGSHFRLEGITLAEVPNHLLQIAGEDGANYPIIRNCIFQDAYEQLFKVSHIISASNNTGSIGGLVEDSIFQYTQGVGPNFYIGGIDAVGTVDWIVRGNVFRDIASPSENIAQHAVHFWVNSANNQVLNNLFIDNDRAIGFGMPHPDTGKVDYSNKGGVIADNVVFHSDNNDPFGDTGIVLEASPESLVENNIVFMEHDYPRAIEYRFKETQGVVISNNTVNRSIASRDGGSAELKANNESLTKDEFVLRLAEKAEKLKVINLREVID